MFKTNRNTMSPTCFFRLSFALGGLLLFGACSSSQNKNANEIPKAPLAPQDATLELLAPTKENQSPRQRRVYNERQGKRVLVSVESDFNGDGRIDFIQIYNDNGQWIQMEKADLDGDGSFDITFLHEWNKSRKEAQLVQEIFDTNYDSKADLWKDFSTDGSLKQRRLDRDFDGRPDYWEHYERGQIIRIEQDKNGDGVPDSAPRPRIQRR